MAYIDSQENGLLSFVQRLITRHSVVLCCVVLCCVVLCCVVLCCVVLCCVVIKKDMSYRGNSYYVALFINK